MGYTWNQEVEGERRLREMKTESLSRNPLSLAKSRLGAAILVVLIVAAAIRGLALSPFSVERLEIQG